MGIDGYVVEGRHQRLGQWIGRRLVVEARSKEEARRMFTELYYPQRVEIDSITPVTLSISERTEEAQ